VVQSAAFRSPVEHAGAAGQDRLRGRVGAQTAWLELRQAVAHGIGGGFVGVVQGGHEVGNLLGEGRPAGRVIVWRDRSGRKPTLAAAVIGAAWREEMGNSAPEVSSARVVATYLLVPPRRRVSPPQGRLSKGVSLPMPMLLLPLLLAVTL